MSDKKPRKLNLSMQAVSDNIVYSKRDQFAYYRVANSVYDFLSNDSKVQLAAQLTNAFTNLMGDRTEPLDCQIITTSIPVDIDAWEAQVREVSETWNRGPGFDEYLAQMYNYLATEEYMKKVVYLGVKLGSRGTVDFDVAGAIEQGFDGVKRELRKAFSRFTLTPDSNVSAREEERARSKEEEIFRILSHGHLEAKRCTAEEILLFVKRQFYPAMPAPYLDVDHDNRLGPGDLELELGSAIYNRLRYLEFNQIYGDTELEGYRATLTMSRFPKEMEYPYSIPFIYFLTYIGLPFTCYSRFRLSPSKKMKKQLEKKKEETRDQFENMAEGNTTENSLGLVASEAQEAVLDMQKLEEMLNDDRTPWVEGTYRIVVEGDTEDHLKSNCSLVKQHYLDLGINVNWTIGDQAGLFLESLPGDYVRDKAHQQVTNLTMLSTSGFNFSSDVGDPIK